TFTVTAPVVFRYADPVKGEIDRPIVGAPAVSVTLDRAVEYASANASIDRTVRVRLRSASSRPQTVRVSLTIPKGLIVDSATRVIDLPPLGAVRTATFAIRGRLPAGRHVIDAIAHVETET